jgi:hypothetical protein
MVAADTLPSGPSRGGPRDSARAPPRSAAMSPRQTGGGFAFERVERRPERVDVDMVEKRGEPLLLPLPCGLSYAVSAPGSRAPGSESGACFADPRSP